jgi:hypothetical protein
VTQQSLNFLLFIGYVYCVSLLISIVCTSGFGRATHPCAERTCLFRLIFTQNGALSPIAASLFLFSRNPQEIPEQGTQFHDEERKKSFPGSAKVPLSAVDFSMIRKDPKQYRNCITIS